jgi:hypothetical protein
LSIPSDEASKIAIDIREEEPIVRVVIFLPLSKAQLLDRMKYLMKVDKSDVIEKALDEAIRMGTLIKGR